MIDLDLLKQETLIGMINEFETEDLEFLKSGILPVQTGLGQSFDWDIMGVSRDLDSFEGRHSPAGSRKLQVIGHQSARLARTFKSKIIPGSILMDLRSPGSEARQTAGENMISQNEKDMKDLIDRQDEFMVASALQGSLAMTIDDVATTINYGIPAANIFANGLGGDQEIPLTWEDLAADIVDDLRRMKKGGVRGSGRRMRHAWTSERVIAAMTKNDTVKDWMRGSGEASSRVLTEGSLGRFLGLDWHVVDHTYVNASAVVTPYLPENLVVLTPDPSPDWGFFHVGSDIIPKDDRSGMNEVLGLYSYADVGINPASIALFAGKVRLPVIRIPGALVKATVLF